MFEIRSYHYDPTKFAAYKKWAVDEAVPFLKANLNVVGFWLDDGSAVELTGSDPTPHKHGAANVTWIIKWESEADRDRGFEEVLGGEGWQDIWSRHPDADGYLQMEARFAEEI
tara:strand:+ start:3647 stop:3985 length:339 start_codon:yes stop_codon:yes gene_type:complete